MKNKWLDIAKKVAHKSTFHKRFRHGAILIKGGSIINEGYNSRNYSRIYHRFSDWGIEHAEATALNNIPKSKTLNSKLYVVRINNLGQIGLSKPCSGCIRFARFCGVKKIYYSIDEKTFGVIKL